MPMQDPHSDSNPQGSYEFFRRLFDESPLGYQSLDDTGRIIIVNQAWLELLGYDKDQVIGKQFSDYITPEYQDKFPSKFHDFLEQGLARDIQLDVVRVDGTVLTVSFNGRISHDQQSGKRSTHCILRDLTENLAINEDRENLNRRTALILNAVHSSIVGFDPEGRITFINPGVTRLTGWQENELLGHVAHYLFHSQREDGSDFPAADCTVCHAIAQREFTRGEENYIRRDGTFFPVEYFVQPYFNGDSYLGGVLSFEDITERKAAQDRLQQSEQQFRQLFENAPVSLWLEDYSKLRNFLDQLKTSGVEDFDLYFRDNPEALQKCSGLIKVVDVNQASLDLHGADSKEELAASLQKTFTPESIKVFQTEIVAVSRNESGIEAETTLNTIDGRLRHVLIKIFRDLDNSEWTQSYIAITDITKAKQSEEINTLLVTAVEQSSGSVIITDPGGVIQYVNPSFERTTGYTRQEAVGNTPALLKSGRHDSAFYKEMWDTISRGEVWRGHLINRHKDGSIFEEDGTIAPLLNPAGEIVNFVSVKRDVTHEIELENRLIQSQKLEAVGQLAGGVAHDFNNILQAMYGHLEFAMDPQVDRAEVNQELADLYKGVERAATLTRQLLAFSRRQVLDLQKVDTNELVAQLLKMMQRLIGEEIKLEFRPGIIDSPIWADPGQTEQVVVNLCINARDAMPDGGLLLIETKTTVIDTEFNHTHPWAEVGSYGEISVSDAGSGMSPEILENIFQPFFTTKEPGQGSGLGLATVYGIIKQHKGIVLVQSAEGKGSTFRTLFPLVPEAVAPIEQSEKGRPEPPLGGNETILLAEDDELVRDVMVRFLSRAGYRVIQAYDGPHALEMFQQHDGEIHLAILDLVMPRMGGKALAKKLREFNPGMKILFNSGYSSDLAKSKTGLSASMPLLQKPIEPNTLLFKVRELLDQD